MAEEYQQHILICESIKIMESVVQFHHGFAIISNSMDNKVKKIKYKFVKANKIIVFRIGHYRRFPLVLYVRAIPFDVGAVVNVRMSCIDPTFHRLRESDWLVGDGPNYTRHSVFSRFN